jgi:hypothetical protein
MNSSGRAARGLFLLLACGAAGCTFGPHALERTRLPYNEAVKTTSEEQLLLNIVRLRYVDTPSSLGVATIAAQFERTQSVAATPFYTAAAAGMLGTYRGTVLPQASLSGADRPTFTLTPLDDQEFTRRLFTPQTLEGVIYLAKTTWPIQTVFRLYLENLNWVSNAETASGPTPKQAPVYADFLRGMDLLQTMQDRKMIVISQEDRSEPIGGPLPAERVTAREIVESAKNGHEYRKDEQGDTWTLVKKSPHPVLNVHPAAVNSPEMLEFARIFRLKPGQKRYDITMEELTPFPVTYPPEGVTKIDLETRSLLQALYFVAQGIEVPPEHLARGLVTVTLDETGQPFDWQQVTRGLFHVCWAAGKKPPPDAHVAVQYKGYWFYIDERDQDTKATFSLLLEMSRLELQGKDSRGPLLTLPLGGK